MTAWIPFIGFLCAAFSCICFASHGNTLWCVITFLVAALNMMFFVDDLTGGRMA